MPVNDQAKAAIAALDETDVYGRKVALSEAVDKGKEERKELQRLGGGYYN